MNRLRTILGLVAGVMLVLSSVAHSVMGWSVMHGQLAATTAPADLVTGLGLGWRFGGVAMLAMGIIVLDIFVARLRARPRSTFPAAVIGLVYLAFGVYAYAADPNPFYIGVFIVPGVLLAVASLQRDQS